MSREITPEHRAKMEEGRRRREAEDARRKAEDEAAYSAWVQRDATLYAALQGARYIGDGVDQALEAWREHARAMPRLP